MRVLRLISHVSRQHVNPIVHYYFLLYYNLLLNHVIIHYTFKIITSLSIYVTLSLINPTLLLIFHYIIHVYTTIISHFTQDIHGNDSHRGNLLFLISFLLKLYNVFGYGYLTIHHIFNNRHPLIILFYIHTFAPNFVINPTTHHIHLHLCTHFSHHL